jgi:hypothetical protein
MPKQLNYDRRRFIGAAAMTMAAGPLFQILRENEGWKCRISLILKMYLR